MAPKLQIWAFTLTRACVRQRPSREYEWDSVSMLNNVVITVKQERLLANFMESRGQLSKEPNHVLTVPLQGHQTLKLGLGSRDGIIPPDFDYRLQYKHENGSVNIKMNAHNAAKEVALQFKTRSDLDQVLRLFKGLGLHLEPSRRHLHQLASRQASRSSSVVSSFQPPFATQPFASRRSITPLLQPQSERMGSSLKNQFLQDGSNQSSRAHSVLANDHRLMGFSDQRSGAIRQPSLPLAASHSSDRERTAFTDQQKMGSSYMFSQLDQYTPSFHAASTTHHKRSQIRSPPLVQQRLNKDCSPSVDVFSLDEIGQPASRPSSIAKLRDMLPPRRELPFSSGKQAGPTSSLKRCREQLEVSGTEPCSKNETQRQEFFQQPTPQTIISKTRLLAEQDRKPPQRRLLVVRRKDNEAIDKLTTKKQKSISTTKPDSTSPIPLPIIPSMPFMQKTIVQQADVPSNPTHPSPESSVEKFNNCFRSEGLVSFPTTSTASSSANALATERRNFGASERPAADTSSISSEDGVDLVSPPSASNLARTSTVLDSSTGHPMPPPAVDHGTQTMSILSDCSAKEDDLFVAKMKLMWDIRDLQQACFRRILVSGGPQQHTNEKKSLQELEQDIIDLCQVAIDRHGSAVGDIPYEKLVNAIIQPGH